MIDLMNLDKLLYPLGLLGAGLISGGVFGTSFGIMLTILMNPGRNEP